ncbi:MAG: tripartite tricarboxylate transporter TctB family protein [Candidatus Nanopelagicaceae bacterium]
MLKFKKEAVGELAFAGSLLLLGVIVLFDAKNMLVPPGSGSVGPQVFPTIIGVFIVLVAIALTVEILRGNYGQPEGTEFGEIHSKTDWKTLGMVTGSILTYPFLIESAGFVVASTVVFFGVGFAYGARKLVKNLLIAIIFALVVYLSFTKLLNVNLPAGILKGLL